MVSPIRGCAAALAALLIPAGASAQDLSGEIDLLELHTDFDQTNLLIDATFDLRQGTRGFEVKATGNGDVGPSMDELQLQGLFLQELGPSTALMAGVRHDFRRGHDVTYASVAVTHDFFDGLAGETFVYLSEHGDLTGSGQLVADVPLSEGLRLEPRVELLWSAQEVPGEGLAAGLTQVSSSVRLRQDIAPGFDAYVGVIHDRLLFDTRTIARSAGESPQATRGVIGVGTQF